MRAFILLYCIGEFQVFFFLLLFFAVLFAGSAGVISPVSPVAASSDVRQAVRECGSGEIQPTAVPLLAREAPTRCAPRSPVERLFAWRSACACASGYKCVYLSTAKPQAPSSTVATRAAERRGGERER